MKINSAISDSVNLSEMPKKSVEVKTDLNLKVNTEITVSEMTDDKGNPTEQAFQTAVNKLNEFMEYNQKNSKFIFHKDLERYYVEVVDSATQEVIKELPPKELLDAYYEMQKLVGKMFDSQV